MKKFFPVILLLISFFFMNDLSAQTFSGEWTCDYATIDDQPNATGYNTPSVGVVRPNTFVALVRRGTNSTCYLVGYRNADSLNGRLGYFGYGSSGIGGYRQTWTSGFDLVEMLEALDIEVTPDSLVYVANNDAQRNILVFSMSLDSVVSTDYRMETGADSIYAIDVDGSGRVYVSSIKNSSTPSQVLVFKSIATEPAWGSSHTSTPLTTITMPEPGEIRGVTVNSEGTVVYASNYTTKRVYCFVGNPTSGYTQYTGFNFQLNDEMIATTGDTLRPGPWGLNWLNNKNVLTVSCAVDFLTGAGYEYSRVYFLNPNTGAILDTLDSSAWNFLITGSYSNRPGGGTQGNVSGYASLYNSDWDSQDKMYTVSYYGWTVDKWSFSGTIPTIPLTITGIEKNEFAQPQDFSLAQNYPNPFNPSTSIEFALKDDAIVTLNLYNLTGELVAQLISASQMSKGSYKFTFDASKLASGNYIYTLEANGTKLSRKMTLIK